MLHIHRHVTGLRTFVPRVLTQKREGEWEAGDIRVVKRSMFRFIGRGLEKLTGRPWQISGGEARRFAKALEDCAVLHIFFGNVAVHFLPLLRRLRIPVVISFHGADVAGSMHSRAYMPALKELFSRSTLVACRSEQLARDVAALGCPKAKLRLMRTMVPDAPRRIVQPPEDGTWRVVQAARLIPKKGIETAVRGFAVFARQFPKATFTIAGDGPLRDTLKAIAGELGVADRVEFTGFLSQPRLMELFGTSHIFLHPSETIGGDTEGIPNAMLEAMSMGLPVVATNHGGIPEVIHAGANGLLVPERATVELAAALTRLAVDPMLYRHLSEGAGSSVRADFSRERQIEAIEDIYREAILA